MDNEQIKQIFVRNGFKLTNEAGDDLKPYVYEAARALIAAAVEQAQAVPVAWHVPPMTQMYFGEYAQIDAEAEARRVGGTAKAIPLYTHPPKSTLDDDTRKMVLELCTAVQEHVAVWTYPHGKQTLELAKQIRERLEAGE